MPQAFQILLLPILFIYSLASQAEDNAAHKSMVLFQTLKHIDWGSSKGVNKPLNFCSLTQNEHSAAHRLALKQVIKSGQNLVYFHHFYQLEDLTDYNLEFGCDIYYFDNVFSQLNIRQNLATAIQQRSVTIGNSETFLLQNGTMAFIEKTNQLNLYLNPHQSLVPTTQPLSLYLSTPE
ncbi:YfiR/HmsC family protein [Catenovulum sp. 2E275]|uniref:YfiR/HmsC family protein n=1 Tax=Catenovulum sp. 2E275 TaxID=2980497 RepID=UPI0021D1F056|nr:YfiR/HmsC family protein [Catenovulum sp. 2E275]MCU4675129.1 YfiR/HmsC family protein [Catenovulum sp. 2E275]